MRKRNVILGFGIFCLLFVGCNKDKKDIVGEWKLSKVGIVDGYYQQSETDYSGKNIVYEFQKNNKLVVTSSTLGKLQTKKYSYKYQKLNVCPTCIPAQNLQIDKIKYYCLIENGVMRISSFIKDENVVDEIDLEMSEKSNILSWGKNFIKLK